VSTESLEIPESEAIFAFSDAVGRNLAI